jgi:formylglycine-generating enzyme required for sulfatase activity
MKHTPLWTSLCLLAALTLMAAQGHAAVSPAAAPAPAPVQPTATPGAEPPPGTTRVRQADGMLMVYVPAGEFLMGSAEGEGDPDEHPQHAVFLDAFWIDRTEVTNAQYRQCVEAGACSKPGCWGDSRLNADQQPAACVKWSRADAYCRWAGARLPTEAEWEKAARGTDGRIYPWGNEFDGTRLNFCDKNCASAWRDSSADDGYAHTAPVGSYPAGASPYGALDMAGNVWEWAADWYAADTYARSPERNPSGPDSGQYRVQRGGSWADDEYSVRSAAHGGDDPLVAYGDVGFRCAVSASALAAPAEGKAKPTASTSSP